MRGRLEMASRVSEARPGTPAFLPDIGQVIETLTIVFVFDAAAHAEFLEDSHHLAYGHTGNLSGAAQGGFALLVLLNGEEESGFPIAGIGRYVCWVIHPDLG